MRRVAPCSVWQYMPCLSDLSPQLWGMQIRSMRPITCSPPHTFGMPVISPRCARHLRAVLVQAQQSQERTKTVLITGASPGGIGCATAKQLAAKGFHTVLACRDMEKGQAAKQHIMEEVAGSQVELRHLDLADLDSIRQFCRASVDFGHPLDVLICNAAVMACPERWQTKQGFELQFGTNHLGHFLLTMLLLPILQNPQVSSRIINVSSFSHASPSLDLDNLMSEKNYSPWGAYSQGKLAQVLFTYELARRLESASRLTCNACNPGLVKTNIQRFITPPDMEHKTPDQGAETSVYLASAPEVEGVTGRYFQDCAESQSSKLSYDWELALKMWEESARLVGLDADCLLQSEDVVHV